MLATVRLVAPLFLFLACQRGEKPAPPVVNTTTPVAAAAAAGEDWNDTQVAWQTYEQGMAAAARDHKPVCLIFFTTWCPHCKAYSRVFKDPRVVEAAKGFVMIRLDKDKNAEVSRQYAPDGEYIPRTYFLAATGVLAPDIHAPRAQFKYFYDENDPASVLAGMTAALQKAK